MKNKEPLAFADALALKSKDEKMAVIEGLSKYFEDLRCVDNLARSLSCLYFPLQKFSALHGQQKIFGSIEKFIEDYYQDMSLGVEVDYLTKDSLRRFVTRESVTPMHSSKKEKSLRLLSLYAIFIVSVQRSKYRRALVEHPNYKFLEDHTQFWGDVEAIFEDPGRANVYFSNKNISTMRSLADVAKSFFQLEKIESEFLRSLYFEGAPRKSVNFICYRYDSHRDPCESPDLVKSYLQLHYDLSKIVRIAHFVRDDNDVVRRTNGGAIEFQGSVFFFGATSEVKADGTLGSALGLKLMAFRRSDMRRSPNSYCGVVLSSNHNFEPVVSKIYLVRTEISHSDYVGVGHTPVKKINKDMEFYMDKSVDLDKLLNSIKNGGVYSSIYLG